MRKYRIRSRKSYGKEVYTVYSKMWPFWITEGEYTSHEEAVQRIVKLIQRDSPFQSREWVYDKFGRQIISDYV